MNLHDTEILCPICGAEMIKRKGSRVEFYGCSNYHKTGCTGKRDLYGDAWGCDDTPYYLDEKGLSMFEACIRDGFSYDEAAECAADWQRLEEKDHWD